MGELFSVSQADGVFPRRCGMAGPGVFPVPGLAIPFVFRISGE
jgi:hypothetical protein